MFFVQSEDFKPTDGYVVDFAAFMPSMYKGSVLQSRFSRLISGLRKKYGYAINRDVRRQINQNFKRFALHCCMCFFLKF